MREVKGNFWTYPADWKCIPTNGVVTPQGKLVMGAGMAKAAKLRFPGIDRDLGFLVRNFGNRVFKIPRHLFAPPREGGQWLSFPTKNHFLEDSDLSLIRESCKQLHNEWKAERVDVVLLPQVGCGLGGLDWEVVQPILREHLPEDNFVVVS